MLHGYMLPQCLFQVVVIISLFSTKYTFSQATVFTEDTGSKQRQILRK